MKQLQLGQQRLARLEQLHALREPALLELTRERRVAVSAERVTIAETVAGQTLTEYDRNLRACGVQRFSSSRRPQHDTAPNITYDSSRAPGRCLIMRAP
jgi:hypothetical protein